MMRYRISGNYKFLSCYIIDSGVAENNSNTIQPIYFLKGSNGLFTGNDLDSIP
jgi:hypothetical protein